ncbi:hypothetical protein AMTR_s00122p00056470 [Amborella trichopoda]|uniref:Uncharacterized protein n=1 Tax=Amborella trichopoda TaxID=13333 RepID=W1NMC4_AMBTC|nr:hypothetical protein AMTR_s00122p00056470 [Amborella trichopoda]
MSRDASKSPSVAAPSRKRKSTKPLVVLEPKVSTPYPTTSESQEDQVRTSETIMIYSDQETTSNPGVASRVQEMGPVTIEPVHELTSAPPSPSRMSLDPCPKEHAPSTLGQASEAASRAADEVLTTVQETCMKVIKDLSNMRELPWVLGVTKT